MQVSIIIPALNEAANIALAIERAWQAGGDEVIVVDGGSSDDTASIVQASGATFLTSAPGRAQQQNVGAQAASGDVLLFLHADTWLAPQAVSQIHNCLLDSNCSWGAFTQHIEASGFVYRWLEQGNAWRVRWSAIAYGDQGLWIRRDLFQEQAGFPETMLLEDLLLSQRLRKLASPQLLPGPLHVSARRWQKHGVVRQTLRNWSILTAHACGVSPARLAAYYRRHDRK